MSLLSYTELCVLVEQSVVTDVEPEQINASSIDLTLGGTILSEAFGQTMLSIRDKQPLPVDAYVLRGKAFRLDPGQFILAHTQQKFFLPPDISAEYKLKSSMARIGLEHLNAGWCDAGWNGSSLTLELKNLNERHPIILREGDRIGQIVFFRHTEVPTERSYAARGRYNGDVSVSGVKPDLYREGDEWRRLARQGTRNMEGE